MGRYGGEEFLIVLGRCNTAGLRKRAEEVREGVCGSPFLTKSGPIFVSVSVGAITIEDWNRTTPIEPFLEEADAALYRAKASGRNLVVYVEETVAL